MGGGELTMERTALKSSTEAITTIPRSARPQHDGTATAKAQANQEALDRRKVAAEFKRRCQQKQRYDHWHEARQASRAVRAATGSVQYPYPCPTCDGWHLTTKKPNQQSQIRKVYQWAEGEE